MCTRKCPAGVIVGYLAAKIAADFSHNVRGKVFHKVFDFGAGEISKFSTSSLITRTTNDITQIQMLVAMGLQVMIKAPIMAAWAIVKIVGKSWQLSVLTASAVVLIMVVIGTLMAVLLPKFKTVQKQVDDVNRVTRENLTGLKVVRAFNAERYQEEKFETVIVNNLKKQGIWIRDYKTGILKGWARISTGDVKVMKRVWDAIMLLDKK
mgnify:CR=1 FL=1